MNKTRPTVAQSLLSNVTLRSLAADATVPTFLRIGGSAATFFVTVIVSHTISLAEAGFFFLALSLVSFLSILCRFGLEQTVVKTVALVESGGLPGSTKSFCNRVFGLISVVTITLLIFCYALVHFVTNATFDKPELLGVLYFLLPSALGITVTVIAARFIQALGGISRSVFLSSVALPASFIVSALSFQMCNATEAAQIYTWLSLCLGALGVTCVYASLKVSSGANASAPFPLRPIFLSCLPLWAVSVLGQISRWSSQWVTGAVVGPDAVAELTIALRCASLVSLALVSLNLVIGPKIASLHGQRDFKNLRSLVLTSTVLVTLVATPLISGLYFYSDLLIATFGEDFSGASDLLRLLLFGYLISVVAGPVGITLVMTGNEKKAGIIAAATACFAVGSAVILVPILGVKGAAISTSMAVALQNVMAVCYVREYLSKTP